VSEGACGSKKERGIEAPVDARRWLMPGMLVPNIDTLGVTPPASIHASGVYAASADAESDASISMIV